jgi:putative tryptophan/tyrosine transport system substrate-binding protein
VDRDNKIDMKRKISFLVLCAMLFALGSPSDAQQAKKVPRIGYLSSVDQARASTRFEAIRLGLREFGYIEGQNITIEYRYAAGTQDRLPELRIGFLIANRSYHSSEYKIRADKVIC